MTPERELQQLLDAWFADGPTQVSDRAFDAAVGRLDRQRQRPAWRFLRREPQVTTTLKVALAAAAIIMLAGGFAVLNRQPGQVGGPAPTPLAAATPTPTSSSTPGATLCPTSDSACTGDLAPGTHSTSALLIPLRYDVTAGWSKPLDVEGSLNLQPTATGYERMIGVWPDWAIASQETCSSAPALGLGRTVDDLVSWLTEHPGLVSSEPRPATVGGLDGMVIDIHKNSDWTGPCPGRVSLFTHQGTINDAGWWDINDQTRMRLILLDAGGGHTVTIGIQTDDEAAFADFVDAANPIVDSFVFETRP